MWRSQAQEWGMGLVPRSPSDWAMRWLAQLPEQASSGPQGWGMDWEPLLRKASVRDWNQRRRRPRPVQGQQ